MASCEEVKQQIQAYLDGELRRSEQLVLEQHTEQCDSCRALLTAQKKTSALLFETLAPEKLSCSLASAICAKLPSKSTPQEPDLQMINWRAKHPEGWFKRALHHAPIAVALFLALVAGLLRYYWPKGPVVTPAVVGMVTEARGLSLLRSEGNENPNPVKLEKLVERGSSIETTSNAQLMLAFRNDTEIKLHTNSRLIIHDDRVVTLDKGEAYLHVGKKDGRVFLVNTPAGKVKVFGTSFLVKVIPSETRVLVEEGTVHIEAIKGSGQFAIITTGTAAAISSDGNISRYKPTDLATQLSWANTLQHDKNALAKSRKLLPPSASLTEIPASHIYRIPLLYENSPRAVHAIRLYWQKKSIAGTPFSYDIYVYDQDMQPLFKSRVEGQVFLDNPLEYYEIPVPGKPLEGLPAIAVSLVPDYNTGNTEVAFEVKAVVPQTTVE